MDRASVEHLAKALNEAGVPFLVVGGAAVVAHGYGRLTRGLDITIPFEESVIARAFEVLATVGFRPNKPVTANGFADPEQRRLWSVEGGMSVARFQSDQHPLTPVGLLVREQFEFKTEYERAFIVEVASRVPLRILSLEALLRLKQAAGRLSDLADIADLRLLHESAAKGPEIDDPWNSTTFEGARLCNHRRFHALTFREKLEQLEEMDKLTRFLEAQRVARMKAAGESQAPPAGHSG